MPKDEQRPDLNTSPVGTVIALAIVFVLLFLV